MHVIEGAATPGGGCRTEELTLPGFWHDVCSAVHPLAGASPFFAGTDLAAFGVRLLTPKVAFAHPLDGGRAAAVAGSVDETAGGARARRPRLPAAARAAGAGRRRSCPTCSRRWDGRFPGHPLALARFGTEGLLPAERAGPAVPRRRGQGLLAGAAAHAMLPAHQRRSPAPSACCS